MAANPTLTFETPVPSAGSQRLTVRGGAAAPSPAPAPDTGPLAPAVGVSFDGYSYEDNAAQTGGWSFIPPDPSGAVGPTNVVSVVNVGIEWFSRTGVLQNRQGLGVDSSPGPFFGALSPANFLFDPKVIYDQYRNRFVVVALEQQSIAHSDPVDDSRILVAVSDDDDPNGTWYYQAIGSVVNIGGTDCWADYPGLAVDEEAVYITANMFTFAGAFAGVRLWIMDKTLYDGATDSGVTENDPYADGGFEVTTQPAHVFGAPPDFGTFLVAYSGISGGGIEYVQVLRVVDPISGPTFADLQTVSSGNIDNTGVGIPDAPQAGAAAVDTGDRRALSAVWRDDALWMSSVVSPPTGTDLGQATAHWWKLDTRTLSAIAVTDQGNVGGEGIATATYTFYPSVAVDKFGNMGIGFAASAATIHPGAYYTGRLAGDAAGSTQPAGTLAAGTDSYFRDFGSGRNRWGDYSGIALDPLNETTFWVFNEYAIARQTPAPPSGGDGRWRTRWGSFFVNPTPVELVSLRATALPERIRIAWRTGAEIDTAGFHLWRADPAGGDAVRITDGPIPAEGGVAVGASYAYADRDLVPGAAYDYLLEDVTLDGTGTFHGPVPAVAGRLVPVDPRRRGLATGAVPPRFRWRADPFDSFALLLCSAPGCGPESRVRLPGAAGNRIRRGAAGWSYRPTAAEWRRVRRLAGAGGLLSWRVLGEDGEGRRGRSAPRLLRVR